MIGLKLSEIAAMAGGKLVGPEAEATGLGIDSRKVKRNDLFVAIRGPRYDGHDFIEQALSSGAAGAVANDGWARLASVSRGSSLIAVPETLAALHRFIEKYRARFDIRMIAITGTNGKTTTKEMVFHMASGSLRVLKNQGNLNNQYGLPLSLADLGPEHQAAVMELGMSSFGEIETLCRMAKPEIGIITNVAEGHTQFLGDLRGVARAKGELLECLSENGTAILNADCQVLMEQAGRSRARVMTFGIERPADVRAESVRVGPEGAWFTVGSVEYRIKLPGRHNVYNALAAIAACDQLGLPRQETSLRLASMEPVPMRQELIKLKDITIINDVYNANPSSMISALESLAQIAGPRRKVAVLADMLELGDIGPQRHREVGELAGRTADLVVAIGPLGAYINEGAASAGARSAHFAENAQAIPFILDSIRPGDTMLIKGSRGMRLEEVVDVIRGRG